MCHQKLKALTQDYLNAREDYLQEELRQGLGDVSLCVHNQGVHLVLLDLRAILGVTVQAEGDWNQRQKHGLTRPLDKQMANVCLKSYNTVVPLLTCLKLTFYREENLVEKTQMLGSM